jgi:hypothetical protein
VSRFETITAAHWRTAIRRARAERNEITEQIKEHMSTNNDGWIKMSERWPTDAEMPVWAYDADGGMLRGPLLFMGSAPTSWTHWKKADIPAPPKEETQDEKDSAEFCKFCRDSNPKSAQSVWHAALAYERAEVGKMLPNRPQHELGRSELVAVFEAIRARCGGGK